MLIIRFLVVVASGCSTMACLDLRPLKPVDQVEREGLMDKIADLCLWLFSVPMYVSLVKKPFFSFDSGA